MFPAKRDARIAGWLYFLFAAPGPFCLMYVPAKIMVRGDAAAGWCVAIADTSSLLAAFLPDSSRAELFGDPRRIAAGVWAPRGKGTPTDGGIVVH